MAAHGTVELEWADGTHSFNIAKIGVALELEEKCDAGALVILQRLGTRSCKVNDFRETIRLGLIGGGKSPDAALKLVKRYVDERPWAESIPLAYAIIAAAMIGVKGDELPEKQPADRAKNQSPSTETMGDSSDPQSTASPPASAGTPETRTSILSGNLLSASMATIEPTAPTIRPQ